MELKVRTWRLLEDCIERGIMVGVNRFLDHNDVELSGPQREALHQYVSTAIEEECDQWFVVESDD